MPHVAFLTLFCFHAHAQGTSGGPAYSPNPYTGGDKGLVIIGAFLEAAQCSCNGEASCATVQVIISYSLTI